MLKLITVILILSTIGSTTGCSTVKYEERPSRVEETTLPNGKVVYYYVTGYSTEDFLKEFYCPSCD